jgi:hypothetical protein
MILLACSLAMPFAIEDKLVAVGSDEDDDSVELDACDDVESGGCT